MSVMRAGIITAKKILTTMLKMETPVDVLNLEMVVPESVAVEAESLSQVTKAG